MDSAKKETGEKPLEKMTVKDLKELAKAIPEIEGVHGKNKAELLSEIKKARGIIDKPDKKADLSIREIKKNIRELKIERKTALAASDKKMATMHRRRIAKMKKKARRAA